MEMLIPFTIIAIVCAGVGLLAWYSIRQERLRTEALKKAADEFGFQFHPNGCPVVQSWLDKFHLFTQGRARTMSNCLRGRTQDLDVSIFDYKYTIGGGKHSQTHRTTVLWIRADDLNLPAFCMSPESFWHRVGASLFGSDDIDFDTHKTFSKAYLLKGKDEASIRSLFRTEVLDHFETLTGVSTEASGEVLVFYRHAVRIDPEKMRAFLEEGFAVLGLFRAAEA